MESRVAQVPISLLLDPELSPSVKVLWIGSRLNANLGSVARQAQTGLSEHTVRQGVRLLASSKPVYGGPRVKIPGALLAEKTVGPQAKVLYGILQSLPGFKGYEGNFTYAALSSLTQLCRNTIKRALTDLTEAGWVQLQQLNQHSPVQYALGRPEWRRSYDEVQLAKRRLERLQFTGEAIMKEYLTLLIDSNQFTENARPGFLINPLTGELLELDRFYQHAAVGYEFHGTQHDRPTERFTQAQVETQRVRDLIKAGLCLYNGIQLVIVRAEDLSLRGMVKKIGQMMPLRDLTGHEALIEMLERESITYQANVPKPS